MRKTNQGILPIVFAILAIILLVIVVLSYVEWDQNRETQISAFKQFIADHNYPLNSGAVTYTNVITLNLQGFEQKCLTLSSESGFGIIDQHTHTWLVFPQEKFTTVDWQTNTAYQWIA